MDTNLTESLQIPQFLMAILFASPLTQLLLLSWLLSLVYVAIRQVQPRIPARYSPLVWLAAAVLMVVLTTPYLYLYSINNSAEDMGLLAKGCLGLALLALASYLSLRTFRRLRRAPSS